MGGNYLNKRVKGSFTIEAVFVLPTVIFTMVFIIYLSFYLHDYCKIQGMADHVLNKAALNIKHKSDIITGEIYYDDINKGVFTRLFEGKEKAEGEIEDYLYAELSTGLFATKINEVSISAKITHITIMVKGRFQMPIGGVPLLSSFDRLLKVEADALYHYPGDVVRMSEVILDTGTKIKGFDKLKEIIEELLP